MTGYRSQPFDPDRHATDTFDSGEPDLDEWLRRRRRTAHRLVRDQLPRKIGRGSPDEIPAVLLARLAVDRSAQGQGIGRAILAEAMSRVLEATTIVAARFVVVDALHEQATTFYEHHGFTRIPDTLRLIQKTSHIAAALT